MTIEMHSRNAGRIEFVAQKKCLLYLSVDPKMFCRRIDIVTTEANGVERSKDLQNSVNGQ